MKKKDSKDFNISNTSDKSDASNKHNKSKKIDDTTLSDSKNTINRSLISCSSDSSIQEKLNECFSNRPTNINNESSSSYINNGFSSSLINKCSSYIKSSFDPKHAYKYFHEEIMSSARVSEEIKNLYSNFYTNIEDKLRTIRNTQISKESVKSKLQPNFWGTQDEESEKLTGNLSLEIDELKKEKAALKNSLIFLQQIILKDLEKIKDFTYISNEFKNGNIDYIDIANRNSDSYDILEFLKNDKYRQLISEGDIDKYNSLNSNEQLEFLKYLASSTDNKPFANNVFSSYANARVDIFNHYASNKFWIDIYSNKTYQEDAGNFYTFSRITIYSLPNIPFWGAIILSRNQALNNEELEDIISYFFQAQPHKLIDSLEEIINSYQDNISNQISEDHYNLLSNVSRYFKEANPAIESSTRKNYADSIKKIQDFQSSCNYSGNSIYNTLDTLSTIHISNNRHYIDENSYEYYSHNITNSRTTLKYELLHTYTKKNFVSQTGKEIQINLDADLKKSSYEYYSHNITNSRTTLKYELLHTYTKKNFVSQTGKEIQINLDADLKKSSYEYIQLNKRYKKNETNKKKLDKKEELDKKEDKKNEGKNEEKNSGYNESQIPAFIKGCVATVTGEFILFIIWSAYFYWHQNSRIMKLAEEANKNLKELLNVEPTIVIKLPNNIKSIFDTIYKEEEENKEENSIDTDEKLINLNIPIYRKETEYNLLETPKILEEIVTTPFFITSFKQINLLIKADSEYFLSHINNFNEYPNLEASNFNIDLIEI